MTIRERLPSVPTLGSSGAPAQGRHGLSWAALINRWLLVFLFFATLVIVWWFRLWESLPSIPAYYFVGFLGAAAWLPYMIKVHSERAAQLLVYDGPGRLTLYRVGRNNPDFRIDGHPVTMTSRTGIDRQFVTDFDEHSGVAIGSALEGFTALDFMADATAFDRLGLAYVAHLNEDRVSRELVAVRAQEIVRDHARRWVSIGIASQDPTPIEAELDALQRARRDDDDDDLAATIGNIEGIDDGDEY